MAFAPFSVMQQAADPWSQWQSKQGFGEPTFTPGFQMETPDMGLKMGGTANWTPPPPGSAALGGVMPSGFGAPSMPNNPAAGSIAPGQTFGDWFNTMGGNTPYANADGYKFDGSGNLGMTAQRAQDLSMASHLYGGLGMPSGSGGPPQNSPATPSTGGYGMSSNPYMGGQADAIRAQQSQLFGDMNNQIRSDSVGIGGLGGSREGVAQGVAMGRAATGLDGALANLYGSNWNQDQNRALSQYGLDQNFYTAQRGQDQSGAALGGHLYDLGTQGQWSPYQNYTNTLSPWSGFGQTNSTSSAGGGLAGAVGGALAGGAYAANRGWWG